MYLQLFLWLDSRKGKFINASESFKQNFDKWYWIWNYGFLWFWFEGIFDKKKCLYSRGLSENIKKLCLSTNWIYSKWIMRLLTIFEFAISEENKFTHLLINLPSYFLECMNLFSAGHCLHFFFIVINKINRINLTICDCQLNTWMKIRDVFVPKESTYRFWRKLIAQPSFLSEESFGFLLQNYLWFL